MTRSRLVALCLLFCLAPAAMSHAAQIVRLDEENWDRYAPRGKEVDAIYGDYVLVNDRIIAVVADAIDGRDVNLSTSDGGGYLIDLTRRDNPADQLTIYRPIATATRLRDAEIETARGKRVAMTVRAGDVTVRYSLADGDDALTIETVYGNSSDKPRNIDLYDSMKTTKTFVGGHGGDGAGRLVWAYDKWFNQAYGVEPVGERDALNLIDRRGMSYDIAWRGEGDKARMITIQPGERAMVARRVTPAADPLALRAMTTDREHRPVRLSVSDSDRPVAGAMVEVTAGGRPFAAGRTDAQGVMYFRLPAIAAEATVSAIGRPDVSVTLGASGAVNEAVKMQPPGYVVAEITDATGGPIPCKVQFIGTDGTETPDWFPDSGSTLVNNCRYSHDGRFRQPIAPGKYDVIVSYGPEYDAVFTQIEVQRGSAAALHAKLVRTVDTTGWISGEFHSHSSPSGDNTSDQRGRVLNLLAEHLEFAPCTEHHRIDTYVPHLEALGVTHLMATCSGMELTGQPLPLNHQNAFPLVYKPRTQNGGGPYVHKDPAEQIERLALWDSSSEKLVQQNHPNLVQHAFDKDLDGKADGGFGPEMLGYMDVIEVHPLDAIFSGPDINDKGINTGKNRIHTWLMLLNQGRYIPGVINTDAHYNFHGSGPRRNWIASPTDDPRKIDTLEVVRASERGRVIMSNGPFMLVACRPQPVTRTIAGPGDTVVAPGGEVTLQIGVQCPNWLDIDRVQVLVNGKADPSLNFTRAQNAEGFGDGVVKFSHLISLNLDADAHLIVIAVGENSTLGAVMGPFEGKHHPMAVSNPIFIDVDGGGFKANRDMLGSPAAK